MIGWFVLLPGGYEPFDNRRKMFVFQHLHLMRDILRAITGIYGAAGLKNGVAFVVAFIDIVDSDTRFFFPGGFYRPVNVHAVHPLSAVFGQQGGVDIYQTTTITKIKIEVIYIFFMIGKSITNGQLT